MFHTFLAVIVAKIVLLDLNLQKLCLLLFVTGIIIVSWLKRLKDRRQKRRHRERLNCWFCNEDVDIQPEKADSWRCPYCDQYNGFTEDGDYKQPLPDQFEVKEFKTPTVCSQSEFVTGTSVLCESCTQNQVLKLRQIAAFVPFNEASYDDEIEAYQTYLEHRYSLCDKCRKQVSNYLTDQDKKLVSKMTDDQLSLLDRLKEKIMTGSWDHHTRDVMPQQPALPRLMFRLCVCAGFIHLIFSLALYSASLTSGGVSADVSYISRTVQLCLGTLPDWLAVWGERISACCGCAFCFWALLAAGKHSLYPVDAIHLLLWLMLTLLTSVTPTAILSWLHLTQGKVLVAGSNVVLAVVCCLRSRRPRHFTVPTVHKKHMNQQEIPVKASARNSAAPDSAQGAPKKHVLPLSTPPSPNCVSNDRIPQVEHVQQNMESLTLGLTRRSASTSSVWSLPAIAADSNVSPDSTTDRMSPSCVQRSQNILFPSKLTFLNLDSDVTASGSRSPSPWMQSNSLQTRLNHDRNHSSNVMKLNQVNDAEAHLGLAFQSHRHVPPAGDKLPTKAADRSQTCNGANRSTCSFLASSLLPDVGPCDSQTPENSHRQLSTSMSGNNKYQNSNVAGKDSNPDFCLPGQNRISVPTAFADNMFNCPEPVVSKLHNSTPRRSQRIARMGKLPKPWPLKKSWSCNIVCDQRDIGRLGVGQTRDFLLSSQEWGRHFTDNSITTNLSPVQELRVGSRICQTALANNKDEQLKNDNLLVKCRPYTQNTSCQVTEFSDDDCDESAGLRQIALKNKLPEMGLRRNDLSWTWLLVGMFMGASLTTNVFLMCHRWWAHVEPL